MIAVQTSLFPELESQNTKISQQSKTATLI